jgi:dTDP-glucose 4,6-dehydratase
LFHTKEQWKRARGARIFISGGTGFFGAWILESLIYCNHALDLGVSASVLCRDPDQYAKKMPHVAEDPAITLLRGNVSTFPFPEDRSTYVIHAAAPTSADAAGRPLQLLDTVVEGTRHMIELARRHGARRFLFVSSGAVYGRQPVGMSHIPEDYRGGPDWLDPASAYAEGKRVAEQLCSIASGELDVEFRIARCFAFVGPHLPLDQHFAIGNFIADALAGRDIQIRGDGTPLRSYLYAADLAVWLWTMLFSDSSDRKNLQVWNVGSSEAISIRELAREVIAELRPELKMHVAQSAPSGEAPAQYVPDIRKVERELGLKQVIPLREAIRRTARWHAS